MKRLLLLLMLVAAGVGRPAPLRAVDGEAEAVGPRGVWLDQTRDASLLLGGEYQILLRERYFRLFTPVDGASVSDREEIGSSRFLFAYGLLGGKLEISTAIDLYGSRFSPAAVEGSQTPAASTAGDVGDSRIGLRIALPTPSDALYGSLSGFMTLPTGNREKNFSTHSTDGALLLGLSLHGNGFRAHLQSGYRINRNEEGGALLYPLYYPKLEAGGDDTDNDALIVRGAVEFSSGRVDLTAELFADRLPWAEGIGGRESPLEVIPGVRVRLRRGWYLSGNAGINLSRNDPGTEEPVDVALLFPDWRLSFSLQIGGMIGGEDRDDDGVKDGFDLCPDDPEDYDGFEDGDGCPDLDNDRDGVPDDWDKAPYDPEDLDGFEDGDGAPDLDNDGDGLPDMEDFCPDDPEDFDGIQDDDGCPDLETPDTLEVPSLPPSRGEPKKP